MTSITIEVPDGYTAVKDGDVIRIEKLPEPEPQKEWMPYEGELVEVSLTSGKWWRPHYFKKYRQSKIYPWQTVDDARWAHARPLSNPLIVQFRPHDGGECPCPGQRVMCMYRGGEIFTEVSYSFSWSHNGALSDIIGWAPVKSANT